jgi:hypothetical protein
MTKEEIIDNAQKIDGWFSRSELGGLYILAQAYLKKGDLAVEVGCWKGRSSYVLARVCKEKGARLICIDTFKGSELIELDYREGQNIGGLAFLAKYTNENLKGLPVEFIVEDSKTAHRLIKNSSVTLCFIDGDHRAPGVYWDVKNYWPKVKKHGVFCGHDYNAGQPDVAGAVETKFPEPNRIKQYDSIWIVEK